ncbi:MAG TPA: DUF423 domain-containing protein [Steroidobacteraceae bacterium]|nr:DUF423 domain-containing protein [Steroidobacteraceae bacterium]
MTANRPGRSRFAMRCIATGALLMLLAVILGAFGAHALRGQLTPARLASFQTGVLYHQVHALGLVLVGIVAHVTPRSRWLVRAAALLGAGIVLFAGSIYAMTFGAPRGLGLVAPLGGVSFMLGWACLAMHAREVNSD